MVPVQERGNPRWYQEAIQKAVEFEHEPLIPAMAKSQILLGAVGGLILGIGLGAAGMGLYYGSDVQESRALFANKVRCLDLGKKYEDDNSSPLLAQTTVLMIDYSPVRHSCVAEVQRITLAPPQQMHFHLVVDIVTGETLTSAYCLAGAECSEKEQEILKEQEAAFHQAIQ